MMENPMELADMIMRQDMPVEERENLVNVLFNAINHGETIDALIAECKALMA